MIDNAEMQPLLDELTRQRDSGRIVQFWLRDDDAVEPTEALGRFNTMTREFKVPACLAVIPANTGKELSTYLNNDAHISIAVHGWAHENHAPDNEKKQELGAHRGLSDIVAELSNGFDQLKTRYPDKFTPLLVPPWNRIADSVVNELSNIGYEALSTFGVEKSAPIRMLNTHVDLIDWKGNRGGRSAQALVADLVKAIKETSTPIGFLTHHLVHDEAAWQFMERLFKATADNHACRWVSVKDAI